MVAELHEKEIYGEESLIGLSSKAIDDDEVVDFRIEEITVYVSRRWNEECKTSQNSQGMHYRAEWD
jgi:hypothetical protein